MAVFEFVVIVSMSESMKEFYYKSKMSSPCRVMNGVHKFVKLFALRLQEETGLLVASARVDVHWESRGDKSSL